MFLIENGYFGDPNPDVNSLHKLLVVAYADFKKFQKERGISCSQGKFVPNFVTRLHEQVSRFGFGAACFNLHNILSQGLEARQAWGTHVAQGLQWTSDRYVALRLHGEGCTPPHQRRSLVWAMASRTA